MNIVLSLDYEIWFGRNGSPPRQTLIEPTDALADDAPGPLDLLGLASQKRQLSACMERLTPPQRQSVALAFFDGLSHAEVAAQLREPLGTVKSWVRRALNTLKGCLDRAALGDQAPEGGADTRRAA